MYQQDFTSQRGVTLVEIMIGILLSFLLLGGVLQIFHSTKSSYRMAEEASRLQENARFAMDFLARDIRAGGYIPCRRTVRSVNVLTGAAANQAVNFFGGAVFGDDASGGDPFNGYPAVGGAAGNRVAGADAITVLRGGAATFAVVVHQHLAAPPSFRLNRAVNGFAPGNIMAICDTDKSAVFQITAVDIPNQTIEYDSIAPVAPVTPGNCTTGLGFPLPAVCNAFGTAGTAVQFHEESRIVQVRSMSYFVGVSSSGTGRSLWRRMPGVADQELVEGVESMQILYGEDVDVVAADPGIIPPPANSNMVDRYRTADNVANWANVHSVRIGLLMQSVNTITGQNDITTYNVAGTNIGTAPPVAHAVDGRLRHVFTSTIKLRNRGRGVAPVAP